MIQIEEGLVQTLQGEVGDSLRIVFTYDRSETAVHHIRDDLAEEYTDDELERAFDQLEIEGMGYAHFERLLHVGRMECAIYGFEGALIFQFPNDEFTGLVVSVDRNVELNPESIIGECTAALPAET